MINTQCKNCHKTFQISSADEKFYANLNLPVPTHCPNCRTQRRMARRNERSLYPDVCAMCGKNMISIFSPDKPYKVYCYNCWRSDKCDTLEYGQDFDFSKPFFEQFKELQLKVPRVNALLMDNENTEYGNYAGFAKDCYLVFGSVYVENCYYGSPYYSKNCVDSLIIRKCELCYECITCEELYHCFYCQDCYSSNDLYFCYDCKGCSDCIGCAGLRNQKYCVFNQQLTQEEYEKEKIRLDFCDPKKFERVQRHFDEQKLKTPRKFIMGVNNEDVSGNSISDSKNTHYCFDVNQLENCKYMAQTVDIKDSYDCNYLEHAEQCVDYLGSAHVTRNFYCFANFHSHNLYYCDNLCENLKDSFGCITVRNSQYCILNKKYSEKDYLKLKEKIIEHMKKTGEWGEFFPINISPYAYNETVANEYFPMKKEDVLAKGWAWKEKEAKDYQKQTYRVPPEIVRVPENICKEILACHHCGKNYKIIPQELAFYKQEKLPIPKYCPECRHLHRMAMRTPRDLWQRQCMCTQPHHNHQGQCRNTFITAYPSASKELIYCKDCYNREIY
jgi:hypothetical protein